MKRTNSIIKSVLLPVVDRQEAMPHLNTSNQKCRMHFKYMYKRIFLQPYFPASADDDYCLRLQFLYVVVNVKLFNSSTGIFLFHWHILFPLAYSFSTGIFLFY